MSLLSALKSLFVGAPQQATSSSSTQSTSVPPVKRAARAEAQEVPATTDLRRVSVPRKSVSVAAGIRCDFFVASGSEITHIPDDFEARLRFEMKNAKHLKTLPAGLKTGSLILPGCSALEELPAGLDVVFLDLQGCTSLRALPDDLRLRGGSLNLKGCKELMDLPPNLGAVAGLDLSGCTKLTRIPEGLTVTSWIDIGGTKIKSLPAGFEHVGLRRSGAPVTVAEVFAT